MQYWSFEMKKRPDLRYKAMKEVIRRAKRDLAYVEGELK